MRLKGYRAILILTLAASAAAQAGSPDYSFVDINYSRIVPASNLSLDDGNGLAVNGSYSLPANFTVVSGLGSAKYDFKNAPSGYDEIVTGYNVGFGYHYPLTSNLDLTAEADYLGNHYKIEEPPFGTFSVDNHGVGLSAGLRAMVTPDLELHGYVGRSHTNGGGGSTHGVKLGFIYDFVSFFGLGFTYANNTSSSGSYSSTTHSYTVFGRFRF